MNERLFTDDDLNVLMPVCTALGAGVMAVTAWLWPDAFGTVLATTLVVCGWKARAGWRRVCAR